MNRNRYISHFSAATFWDIPYLDVVLGSSANLCEAIDYTYYRSSNRYFGKGERAHLCQTPLPARAVKCVSGKYIASPELVFVQLAGKIDFHRLILLGLQLCSHPPGKPELSVTTKNKLKNFVDKSSGLEGHRKAAQAIKYLENGSASIMESLAFMVLTLPNFLGGYGLKELCLIMRLN